VCQVGLDVSEEGVLLFVRGLSISVDDWVRLSALAAELGHLRPALTAMMSVKVSGRHQPQLAVRAGWLYRRRRRILRNICCSTDEHRRELLSACEQKLALYR